MDENSNVNRENNFRNFGESILESAGEGIIEGLRQSISKPQEDAYLQGINTGKGKTIAALYEANVEDSAIIELMNKHWDMTMRETTHILTIEKRQAALRELQLFLELEGYSESMIRSFMIKHSVTMQMKENPELQKLRNDPKKLKSLLLNNEEKFKK